MFWKASKFTGWSILTGLVSFQTRHARISVSLHQIRVIERTDSGVSYELGSKLCWPSSPRRQRCHNVQLQGCWSVLVRFLPALIDHCEVLYNYTRVESKNS